MQLGDSPARFRRSAFARALQNFEPLEARCLLSGDTTVVGVTGPFDITKIPVYHASNNNLLDVKAGPLANAGSHLADLYVNYRRAVKSGRDFVNTDSTIDVIGDKVGVNLRIRTNDLDKFVKGLQNAYDFDVTATNPQYSVVEGYLPVNWLLTIAGRADVAQINPIYGSTTHQQGVANNQGDQAENADAVRVGDNLTGKGVTIGVLSDSVSRFRSGLNDSVRTGDLPSDVNVVFDSVEPSGNTDEGRGMLEEIHDIVPDAKLAFATALGGQQAFANNIVRLQQYAHASVIVDDFGYFAEPMFQEGVIDTAIDQVVANGATYLTAAGNSGNSGIEHALNFVNVNGRTLENFNDSGSGAPQTRMNVTIADGGALTFEWDNPYNGITGAATSDLDILFYKPGTTTLVTGGGDNNIVSGAPLELFGVDPGTYDVEIVESQNSPGIAPPTMFKLAGESGMTVNNVTDAVITSTEGHSASPAGISVGAVPFYNAPPFSSTTPIKSEDFSSQGGGVYLFDSLGNRLSSAISPLQPLVSGIDGVNTSFFGGGDDSHDSDNLPNFFGTSAAAPNVAAVVAMIQQATPGVTQAQVIKGLTETARALNGSSTGVWDPVGGFGLVNAAAAVTKFVVTPTVQITPVAPDPRSSTVDSITITFNQFVNGFTRDDLTLRLDGGTNLLTTNQTLSTKDNITFTLTGLASITGTDGTYRLVLNASGAGVTNASGGALTQSATETWTKTPADPLPEKPRNLTVATLSSNAIQLNWDDSNTVETQYVVQRALDKDFTSQVKNFYLDRNTESYLMTGLMPGTQFFFRVRALNATGPGLYSAALSATTRSTGEIILDDDSAGVKVTGYWGTVTSGSGFIGDDYLQDGNSAKGTKVVRYDLPLQGTGKYYVYAHWTAASNRATNTPFDIVYGTGQLLHTTVLMDQKNRGGDGWVLVGGPYFMDKDSGASVRIRNTGTNGVVVADALRILPQGPIMMPSEFRGNAAAAFTGPQAPRNDQDFFSPPNDQLL